MAFMRNNISLFSGIAFLLLSSCKVDTPIEIRKDLSPVSFQASIVQGPGQDPVCKVTVGEGEHACPILWESGDRIAVLGTACDTPSVYITDANGTSTAKFQHDGGIADNPYLKASNTYIATYPATATCSDGKIRLEVPYRQTYRKDGIIKDAWPMLAFSSDNELHFKNLCGLVKLSLSSGFTCQAIRQIKIGARQNIGNVKFACTGPEDIALESVPNGTETIGQTVTLTCPQEELAVISESQTAFYIAIAPGRYSNLAFQLEDYEGNFYAYSIPGSTEIQRNTITEFSLPIEAFFIKEQSRIEQGQNPFVVKSLEYRLSCDRDTIRCSGRDSVMVGSLRYADLDSESIQEAVPWTLSFSTDGEGHYSEAMPDGFFEEFKVIRHLDKGTDVVMNEGMNKAMNKYVGKGADKCTDKGTNEDTDESMHEGANEDADENTEANDKRKASGVTDREATKATPNGTDMIVFRTVSTATGYCVLKLRQAVSGREITVVIIPQEAGTDAQETKSSVTQGPRHLFSDTSTCPSYRQLSCASFSCSQEAESYSRRTAESGTRPNA